MATLTLIDHLFVVSLCAIFLVAVTVVQPGIRGQRFSSTDKIVTYWGQSLLLYLISAAALVIWFWNGREAPAMGWACPDVVNRTLWLAGSMLFLTMYTIDLVVTCLLPGRRAVAARRWRTYTPFLPENRREVLHGLQLAFCAGLTEEILFRGYLINYFVRLLTDQPLNQISQPESDAGVVATIVITSLIFGVSHLYLGWVDVVKVTILAVIFGFIFVVSRSLLPVILLHVLVDVVAMVISPWIAGVENVDMPMASAQGTTRESTPEQVQS